MTPAEPTNEQLARFMTMLEPTLNPFFVARAFEVSDELRQEALDAHRAYRERRAPA